MTSNLTESKSSQPSSITPILKSKDQTNLSEKTNHINALSNFINSASKILLVIVILIIGIKIWGGFSISQIRNKSVIPQKSVTVTIPEQKLPEISSDVALALGNALVSAKESATDNLDEWKNQVMK